MASIFLASLFLFLFLVAAAAHNIIQNKKDWSELNPVFLGDLIKLMIEEQNYNCDIFYIRTNTNTKIANRNHKQGHKMPGKSLHSIVESITQTWLIGQTGTMEKSFRSNGIYQLNLVHNADLKNTSTGVSKTRSVLKLRSFDFVHKQSSQCALVFIDFLLQDKDGMSHNNNNDHEKFERLSEYLSALLTSNYGSMTRKDEDHFVFLTDSDSKSKSNLLQNVLDMKFSQTLKFKMILYESEKENGEIRDSYVIHCLSVCFYCNNGLPSLIDIGHTLLLLLQSKSNLNQKLRADLIFPDFTRNAYGHELQVSAQTRLVFVYSIEQKRTKDGDLRWYFKRGFGKSVVDGITTRFNYTYRVHPAMGNGGSGALLANGTWLGSVRDIIDGTADIGVAVALNYARYQLIGGNSFFYAWVNFIMGKPKPVYSLLALLHPFKIELWLAVGVSIVFLISTFKILALRNDDAVHAQSFNRHLSTYIILTLVEKDIAYPKANSSRMLCGIWLLAAVIIATAYRSELVTLLTFPPLQNLPETFSQLVESNFDWGLESSAIGGAAHQHFRSSPNTVNKKIFSRMSLERDSHKCFTEPIKRNFACITWSTQGEYILHRNFTNAQARNPLVMSEDLSAIVGSGIAYKKRAIFRHNFDRLVDSIREMGMADKWKTQDYDKERDDHIKWLKKQNNGLLANPVDTVRGLILEKLLGIFYCFIAGLFLASVVFTSELLKMHYLFILGIVWNKLQLLFGQIIVLFQRSRKRYNRQCRKLSNRIVV